MVLKGQLEHKSAATRADRGHYSRFRIDLNEKACAIHSRHHLREFPCQRSDCLPRFHIRFARVRGLGLHIRRHLRDFAELPGFSHTGETEYSTGGHCPGPKQNRFSPIGIS